jgi:hypothetical protein
MPCQCPDCRRASEPPEPCEVCGLVECECLHCPSCGARTDDLCADCGDCPNCCACDRDEMPYESSYSRTEVFRGEPSQRYPRYIGVEIECMLSNLTRRDYVAFAKRWNAGITSDGSIRNDPGTHECEHVTSPARGNAFVTQIKETCEILHKQGAQVNKTCGLHVHVDARDYDTGNILAFARLYSRVEKTMYAMVARARRTNDFSKAWGPALADVHTTSEGRCSAMDVDEPLTKREKALDIATYGSESHAQSCKLGRRKDSSRYHGLNFNALACHGTIEFRLHHGTVNHTKIAMWAAVCSALVEYAKGHSEAEIQSLRGTPAEILDKVVSDAEVSAWCRKRRAHFDILDRQRRGLAPRARPVTPEAAPAPEIPEMPSEAGEESVTPPRAYRAYR